MVTTQFMQNRPTDTGYDWGQPLACGGTTVAIHVVSETRAIVGLAYCSPRDGYNKKLGRTIALGRVRSYLTDDAYKLTPQQMVFEVDTMGAKTFKQAVNQVIGADLGNQGYY